MYVGQEDSFHADAQQVADSSPETSFISLAGLTHASTFERSDLVIPPVLTFLTKGIVGRTS